MKKLRLVIYTLLLTVTSMCFLSCSTAPTTTSYVGEAVTNDTLRERGVGAAQIAFSDSISRYADEWSQTNNRIKMGQIMQHRHRAIASWVSFFDLKKVNDPTYPIPGYKIKNWIGLIADISLDDLQNATIDINLCSTTSHYSYVKFRTMRVDVGSNVYNDLSEINVGEWVSFSGRLLADPDDVYGQEKLVSLFDDAVAYSEDVQIENENGHMFNPVFYIFIDNVVRYQDFVAGK